MMMMMVMMIERLLEVSQTKLDREPKTNLQIDVKTNPKDEL
jgi:hypothetical protein